MNYMEVSLPEGDGFCSDDECPCGYPGALIPHGEGYLFIPEEVVEFRSDALTREEVKRKLKQLQDRLGPGHALMVSKDVYSPILMCKQGAEMRKLDLEIAAKDAKYCWEKGLAPLRPTPLAGSVMARIEKGELKPKSE